MNYYPFNVGDYAAHTAHLEPMEDLAYRRLLDQYYLRESPLPADIQTTAKLVRMRSMSADVESVLLEFFVLTDAGWTHKRCDLELQRMQDKQAKARASAQVSVNVRRANAERSLPKQQADAERTLPEKQADVELPTPTPTLTTTKEEKKKTERASAPAPVSISELVDAGFSEETAAEFIAHKARVKAPLTARAWADHQREAAKAGWSPLQAAEKVLAKSWRGFEAKYVADERPPPRASPQALTATERRVMREMPRELWAPHLRELEPPKPTMEIFDVTARALG